MTFALQQEFLQQAAPPAAPAPKAEAKTDSLKDAVKAYGVGLKDEKTLTPAKEDALWKPIYDLLARRTDGFTKNPAALADFVNDCDERGPKLPQQRRDGILDNFFDQLSDPALHRSSGDLSRISNALKILLVPNAGDKWGPQTEQAYLGVLHDLDKVAPAKATESAVDFYTGTSKDVAAMTPDQKSFRATVGAIINENFSRLTASKHNGDHVFADEQTERLLKTLDIKDSLFGPAQEFSTQNRSALGLASLDVTQLRAANKPDADDTPAPTSKPSAPPPQTFQF